MTPRAPTARGARHGLVGVAALMLWTAPAASATPEPPAPAEIADQLARQVDAALADAEARFGVPRAWLTAIIAVESGGDPRAVSAAGAQGLMQVMPGTWRDLRAAHDLGADPFDVRDNILAGAAYVRQLHDRYGAPGFLAAYNAGPARYEAYRDQARALPAETRRYVAQLSARLGFTAWLDLPAAPDWRRAALFPRSPPADAGAATGLFPIASPPTAPPVR